MKKFLIFLFINLLCCNLFANIKIVSWDNKEKSGDDITFDGVLFNINDEKIPVDEVSYIMFNQTEKAYNTDTSLLENVTPEELIKRAGIMEKQFADSSLLILHDEGIEKLNTDGSRYTRSRYSVKIMNEKEIPNYNILSLYYEKGDYESKILMARSISPDGVVTYLNPDTITLTKPNQGLDFFSQRKEEKIMKAVIPNVKVGSIVDFEYEIMELSPEDKNQYYASWFFAGEKPVYKSKIYVTVPKNKDFYYVLRNCDIKPLTTESDTYKTYIFETGISAPIIPEPNSPPDINPCLFGSVFKDQTYLSGWLSKFIKERLVANDEMKNMVDKLLSDAKADNEDAKLAVLYKFVQEYVKYRSIKTSLSSGFSGHPAIETYNNRYGDCIDKSILFTTLLNIAGVESYPVIVNTNDNMPALYNEIGVVTGNHAINEIHLKNGKIIYLDTTSTTYRYPSFRLDDQGIKAWNPILNTVNLINPIDPVYNTQNYTKEINLLYDGSGDIKNHMVYSGDTEAGIREYIQTTSDGELKDALRSIINRDYPGAILINYEFGNPADFSTNLFLDIHYKSNNIAKVNSKYLIFTMPVSFDFDYISLKERKFPLIFQTTDGRNNNISIIIPNGYKIAGIPDKIKIENKFFSYQAEYKIEKNKIIYKDSYKRFSCRIEPEDYKAFKDDMLKIDNFIRVPLIFIKK